MAPPHIWFQHRTKLKIHHTVNVVLTGAPLSFIDRKYSQSCWYAERMHWIRKERKGAFAGVRKKGWIVCWWLSKGVCGLWKGERTTFEEKSEMFSYLVYFFDILSSKSWAQSAKANRFLRSAITQTRSPHIEMINPQISTKYTTTRSQKSKQS